MREEWGGIKVVELREKGISNDIIAIVDRYDAEGPLSLEPSTEFITEPAAQWDQKAKNCENLAMSIEQQFSKTIFSEQLGTRKRWKELLNAYLEAKKNEK